MQVKHHLLNVSVTIGGSLYPDHGNEGEKLFETCKLGAYGSSTATVFLLKCISHAWMAKH